MAVVRHIGATILGVAALMGWGHLRANAAEERVLTQCEKESRGAFLSCTCAIEHFNEEVGLAGRSMSAAPILNHVYAVIYDRDRTLRSTIAAECGAPDLYDVAG